MLFFLHIDIQMVVLTETRCIGFVSSQANQAIYALSQTMHGDDIDGHPFCSVPYPLHCFRTGLSHNITQRGSLHLFIYLKTWNRPLDLDLGRAPESVSLLLRLLPMPS